MTVLEGLLAGIVSDPQEETRWLVLADWLEEFDDPRRAELLRLHRRLLSTCCEPEQHPERGEWQTRIVALIVKGVRPCVPQDTLVLPGGVEMTFSFIPPGTFLMGSDHKRANADEKPVHRVTLTKGFFLGIHPVTQTQWKAVTGSNPSHFPGDNRPVEYVSWDDCQEFCKTLTAHLEGRGTMGLPSEAEWEYACRAGTTTEYWTGNGAAALKKAGWYSSNSGNQTHPVGELAANAWGLHDMHGNVWEWCQDGYRVYESSDQTDPRGQTNNNIFVLRGGGWYNQPGGSRATFRFRCMPGNRGNDIGCRISFRLD
jgi:uncharacterized protein (TIGR02996 family)